MIRTLVFAAVSVAIEVVLGIIIVLALKARMRGRGLVRAAVLIPWAIPTVVATQMSGWMLHDQAGVVNEALLTLGIIAKPLSWAADPNLIPFAAIAVDVRKATPFMAPLTLAALQRLPGEQYEAAQIDGFSPVGRFFRNTVPLILLVLAFQRRIVTGLTAGAVKG